MVSKHKLSLKEVDELTDHYIDNYASDDRSIRISTAVQGHWLDKDLAVQRTNKIKETINLPEIKQKKSQKAIDWISNADNYQKHLATRATKETNPEWYNKTVEKNKKNGKDEKWLTKNLVAQQKSWATKERQDIQQNILEKRWSDPKNRKSQGELLSNLWKNKDFLASRKLVALKRTKPIFTTQYGIFRGMNMAMEYFNNEFQFKNGRKWLLNQMKKDPKNFYYISIEEYTKLTGQNPWA